jgi:hypothetical protein
MDDGRSGPLWAFARFSVKPGRRAIGQGRFVLAENYLFAVDVQPGH